MYNDKEFKLSFNWKDIIVKVVLLIILIVILIWLIPRPQLETFYDRIFNENIQTMKNAAKGYYTVDRLPKKVGDTTSMTLGEMIDKHLLLPFVDKDNNACSNSDSYVQVKKISDTEYELTVQLSCGNQKDYIVETLGCYDLCPNGNCNVNDTTQNVAKVTEYEFKKEVPKTTTTYTCPAGYTKKGTLCYKDGNVTTIKATVNYFNDTVLAVDAKANTTGTYLVYADAIKKDTLVCPNGYTSAGNQCVKSYKASATITSGSYSCPSGYTLNGATCYKTYSATYNESTTKYECPSDKFELVNNKCVKYIDATYTAGKTTYSCNGTDKLNTSTNTCTKSIDATANVTYGDWKVSKTYSVTTPMDKYTNDTEKLVYDGMTYKYTCDVVSKCPVKAAHYNYTLWKRTATTSYSCASGNLVGNKCVSTYKATATTSKASYVCEKGTVSGSKCKITKDPTVKTVAGGYSCPNGGTVSGTLCRLTTTATASGGTITETCPYGGTLSNSYCVDYTTGTNSVSYSCPTGYTSSGSGVNTICYKSENGTASYYCENKDATLKGTKCYYTVKGSISGYTCPAGYTKNGTNCTKTEVISINATSKTETTSSYTYTWSTNKTLSGWTATGKTRLVNKK